MATDSTQTSPPPFDQLWNYADPAGTEEKFRAVLAEYENTGPKPYLAELLTQIARTQGLQDHFQQAHETLDRAEKFLTPETPRPRIRCLLERGRVFNSIGNPAKALPLFQQAWELGQSAGETRLAFDALHMVAIAQPDPASQVEWNLKGIAAVETTPSESRWLPAFYNNLGEAHSALGQYQQALDAFQKLNELAAAKGKSPDIYTQKDIARTLRKLGRAREALAIIRPIHEDLASKNTPDGWIDEEMAESLHETGDATRARPLFTRAHETLTADGWLAKNDPARLARLKTMSE